MTTNGTSTPAIPLHVELSAITPGVTPLHSPCGSLSIDEEIPEGVHDLCYLIIERTTSHARNPDILIGYCSLGHDGALDTAVTRRIKGARSATFGHGGQTGLHAVDRLHAQLRARTAYDLGGAVRGEFGESENDCRG